MKLSPKTMSKMITNEIANSSATHLTIPSRIFRLLYVFSLLLNVFKIPVAKSSVLNNKYVIKKAVTDVGSTAKSPVFIFSLLKIKAHCNQ